MKRFVIALACLAFLSGCIVHRPSAPAHLPKYELRDAATVRTTWAFTAEIILPPGEYYPLYSDGDGVFYGAQRRVLVSGRPNAEATVLIDQGMAVALWIDGASVIDRFDRPVTMSLLK